MAQADNTKANKLAHLHMRIVRRVLRCLLQFVVTRGSQQRTLYQFIEENGLRILETELGRQHWQILLSSQVTIDELALYLIEFLLSYVADCAFVPRNIKAVINELHQRRKELYTEIVKGVDDSTFTDHLENVEQHLISLCQFIDNRQLTLEIQESIANIRQPTVDHGDEVLDEFKQHQEQEKSHRKAIPSFTQDQRQLHSLLQQNVVSIREADEPGYMSDQKVLQPRPVKYMIHVPDAVIELAVQNSNNSVDEELVRDIVSIINSQDGEIGSTTLSGQAGQIKETFQKTFAYGEFYARQGCVQICVKPRTIKHLFELFEDCVSGELTKKLQPVEKLIRGIPNFENYKQKAVLYQDHYDLVMNDIASQMCQIFSASGLTLPNEGTVPEVELSNNGTILVRVPCPSIQERDEYENAIKAGRLNDLFRTLEDNLRNAYSVRDLVLNAAVVDRASEHPQDTATFKQRGESVLETADSGLHASTETIATVNMVSREGSREDLDTGIKCG